MELQNIDVVKTVKQHNTITSGRYDFTACQLDILFMLLACLSEKDEATKLYNIRVKDIELITGRQWNYQQVAEATENLLGRVYEIQMHQGLRQVVLFSYVQYVDGTGGFDIKINPDARQYFFDLKNNFTVLQLKSVLTCSSKHAKRLYSLACQWRVAGGHIFEIGELKEMLGLKDPKGKKPEQYSEITMFKKFVLDIAKKQINENTDITFDYALIKRGRAYTKIKIFAGSSVPEQLSIDFQKTAEENIKTAEHIQKVKNIMALGISEIVAEMWAVKYWKEFVAEKNIVVEAMKKGKAIDDKAAYLVGVFKKKGYV
jgi:plasmid replication initiation protein